jgi:hypothetical protein
MGATGIERDERKVHYNNNILSGVCLTVEKGLVADRETASLLDHHCHNWPFFSLIPLNQLLDSRPSSVGLYLLQSNKQRVGFLGKVAQQRNVWTKPMAKKAFWTF